MLQLAIWIRVDVRRFNTFHLRAADEETIYKDTHKSIGGVCVIMHVDRMPSQRHQKMLLRRNYLVSNDLHMVSNNGRQTL